MIDADLGEAVCGRRTQLGWSRAALAELCYIDEDQLSHYESGATKMSELTFARIARCLGISPSVLAGRMRPAQSYSSHR